MCLWCNQLVRRHRRHMRRHHPPSDAAIPTRVSTPQCQPGVEDAPPTSPSPCRSLAPSRSDPEEWLNEEPMIELLESPLPQPTTADAPSEPTTTAPRCSPSPVGQATTTTATQADGDP